MNELKRSWKSKLKKNKKHQQETNWGVYTDLLQAQANWEEAYMYFEEALGEDQVDYAIYMLEAAERKYQIHLKQAKKLGISRTQFSSYKEIMG